MATRKVKNAIDLTTNELIYFKGHAKATYMSDGRTVEDAITFSTGGSGGNIDTSNLATKDEVSQKQDIISDLETIRQGAAKGATALQSYTEQYKGTVTGVKINGTTKNPSNGVVDLGTVITSHQNISGKQDKLVSGTNIKTINGQSILGSGDIVISGASGDYATTAYVDGLIGDINSVLESIISGGVSVNLITFGVAGVEYQAEEGMTWEEFVNSKYNDESIYIYAGYIYYMGRAVVGAQSTDTIKDGYYYTAESSGGGGH